MAQQQHTDADAGQRQVTFSQSSMSSVRRDAEAQEIARDMELDGVTFEELPDLDKQYLAQKALTYHPGSGKAVCRFCRSNSVHHFDTSVVRARQCLVIRNAGPLHKDFVHQYARPCQGHCCRSVGGHGAANGGAGVVALMTAVRTERARGDALEAQVTLLTQQLGELRTRGIAAPVPATAAAARAPVPPTPTQHYSAPAPPRYSPAAGMRHARAPATTGPAAARPRRTHPEAMDEQVGPLSPASVVVAPLVSMRHAQYQALRQRFGTSMAEIVPSLESLSTEQLYQVANSFALVFPVNGPRRILRGIGGAEGYASLLDLRSAMAQNLLSEP